jgi:hypothetical protein
MLISILNADCSASEFIIGTPNGELRQKHNVRKLYSDVTFVAQALLNNPAFSNKPLFVEALMRNKMLDSSYSILERSIKESFNHRGINVETFKEKVGRHRCYKLVENLYRGVYNPYVWDLYSHLTSVNLQTLLSDELYITDTGMVVGYLKTSAKGHFNGGQVVLDNEVYRIESEGLIKGIVFSPITKSSLDGGKCYVCLIPIFAFREDGIAALRIIGLQQDSITNTKVKASQMESTKDLSFDTMVQSYTDVPSIYTSFWHN